MAGQRTSGEELFSKGLGMAIALGALAVGVAAAMANNERTRQMRDELGQRMDDLGRRMDDLSVQAQQMLRERRPEIEDTIHRSRQAVVQGLDKMRNVVEQGADQAQTYVQRMSEQQMGGTGTDTGTGMGTGMGAGTGTDMGGQNAAGPTDMSSGASASATGEPTHYIAAEGNEAQGEPPVPENEGAKEDEGQEPLSFDDSNRPASY